MTAGSAAGAFPGTRRLRRRPEFLKVYAGGRRVAGRLAVVFALAGAGAGARLGITVTRKAGGAVVRNRLRRRVREIFRQSETIAAAPPVDLVVNLSPRAAGADFADLKGELERLFARAVGAAR